MISLNPVWLGWPINAGDMKCKVPFFNIPSKLQDKTEKTGSLLRSWEVGAEAKKGYKNRATGDVNEINISEQDLNVREI